MASNPMDTSEEILKKNLPAAFDSLAGRPALFDQVIQYLESEYTSSIRSGKPEQIAQVSKDAKNTVVLCTKVIMEDIARVSDEISELLLSQSSTIDSLAVDVNLLSTNINVAQQQHLTNAVNDLKLPPPPSSQSGKTKKNGPIIREISIEEALHLPPGSLSSPNNNSNSNNSSTNIT